MKRKMFFFGLAALLIATMFCVGSATAEEARWANGHIQSIETTATALAVFGFQEIDRNFQSRFMIADGPGKRTMIATALAAISLNRLVSIRLVENGEDYLIDSIIIYDN